MTPHPPVEHAPPAGRSHRTDARPRGTAFSTELLIAVLLSGAACYFLALPLHERAAHTRERLEDVLMAGAEATPAIPAGLHDASNTAHDPRAVVIAGLERVRADAGLILTRSASIDDTTRLFESLYRLGERHRVRIEQLEPHDDQSDLSASPTPPPPPPPPPADAAAGAPLPPPPPRDRTLRVGLTLSGHFLDVADFIHSYTQMPAFVVVRSLRLTPTADQLRQTIEVTLVSDHLAFDAGAVTAALAEADAGLPDPRHP